MGLILLEALLALAILVAIVWWTMFSGRKKGELPSTIQNPAAGDSVADPAKKPSITDDRP